MFRYMEISCYKCTRPAYKIMNGYSICGVHDEGEPEKSSTHVPPIGQLIDVLVAVDNYFQTPPPQNADPVSHEAYHFRRNQVIGMVKGALQISIDGGSR